MSEPNGHVIPENLRHNFKIADTTGAGDNFDAGLMHAWLSGNPEGECMQPGFSSIV